MINLRCKRCGTVEVEEPENIGISEYLLDVICDECLEEEEVTQDDSVG